ncbi:MAG: alpha/beta fold hydrolase [Spirochaetota bacterium]
MKTTGTLFLHGYGVRGGTWDTVRSELGARTGATAAPDLHAADVDELVTLARGRVRRFSVEQDGPVLVVGHSLGSILAALTALEPGPPQVAGVVLISPPYGERENTPGPIMKFLLRHRLVPPALLRPRFFSSHTPLRIQKEIFANAVPEEPGLRELTLTPRFFHTDLFTEALSVPSLVLASEADRIVPSGQSETFGGVLGSRIVVIPESEHVGHDDFFAAPDIARRTADTIAEFAAGLG